MRIIRAHDGDVLSMQDQPNAPPNPSLEVVHAVLSEISNIPVAALVAMHASGRQVDRESARTLLQDAIGTGDEALVRQSPKQQHGAMAAGEASQAQPHSQPTSEAVYLFDRELLELDLHTEEGQELLHHMDANTQDLILEAEDDPVRQSELTLHLISSIRNQRAALSAATSNLERHRGGRQDAINAYSHFASPLVDSYRSLLAVYPKAIALAEKVRVSHKLQAQPSSNTRSISPEGSGSKDRYLADYVSLETMQVVRDACQRALDELERKTNELQRVLSVVADGTNALKAEFHQLDMADLDAAESDAQDAQQQLQAQGFTLDKMSASDRNELATEVADRLEFAVQYKNENTRRLLASLQRIAVLQSHIANMPGLINNLNNDLRTKCDGFKHLNRLKSLVPAYVATMAEAVRRQLFARAFGEIAIGFDELSVSLLGEERRRRGLYQAEWAGKLSWEISALQDVLPALETKLQPGQNADASQLDGCTMEDLSHLIGSLDQISRGQSELAQLQDAGSASNPLIQSLSLAHAASESINALQAQLAAALNRLKASGSPSNDDAAETQDRQAKQDLANLQAKCAALEKELLLEKAARQSQETSLQARITQETQVNGEAVLQRRAAAAELDETKKALVTAREAAQDAGNALATQRKLVENLSARLQAVEQQAQAERAATADQAAALVEETRLRKIADTALLSLRSDLQKRIDSSSTREKDLRQELADKTAAFVSLQQEQLSEKREYDAELDRHQRAVRQAQQATQAAVAQGQVDLDAAKVRLDSRDAEIAELQVMCNERGKSLQEMALRSEDTAGNIRKMLSICRQYFSAVFALMNVAGRERSASDPGSAATPSSSDPYANNAAAIEFDDSSLQAAITSLEALDFPQFEAGKARVRNAFAQTRKWQRECKRYKLQSDKALADSREKIAFRSFNAGDLALFLPTRNPSLQHFAAFNYGKPNYFLEPEGPVAEQVKARDWIVARIVSITEGVADANVAGSNPYALAPGSKYFTLSAEAWRRDKARDITAMPGARSLPADTSNAATATQPEYNAPVPVNVDAQVMAAQLNTSPTLDRSTDGAPAMPSLEAHEVDVELKAGASNANLAESQPDVVTSWSALSAQRPATLAADDSPQPEGLPSQLSTEATQANESLSTSLGSEVPAFLPSHSRTLASKPVPPTAQASPSLGPGFSRSYSSNESRSPGSAALKRLSGSVLMSNIVNKAGSTLSNVTIDGQTSSGDWSDVKRTQTIGRYAGSRSYSARPAISAVQREPGTSPGSSDAASLLRSFTAASKSLTKRDIKAAK